MNEQVSGATLQMPPQASTLAPTVDSLYYDIYWISVVFFVAIVGCMVLFAWRFRRRKGVVSKPPGHHNLLELFWTFSPLILLAYMFHQGFEGFMYLSVPPENSMNIRVRAKQWEWTFIYPNVTVPDPDLWVPDGQPIRLIMSSEDVLHSFFVPSLRVKRDLVPGMYTSLWFEPTRASRPPHLRNQPWVQDIFCAEYCGAPERDNGGLHHADGRPEQALGHSGMWSRIHIVSRREFDEHLEELEASLAIDPRYNGDYAAWGRDLFVGKPCPTCHTVQAGATSTGPNLRNVVGYPQALEGGGQEMANLEYLRTALRQPQAHIVRGYGSAARMPPFGELPEIHIDALIAYVASLSDRGQPVVQEVTTLHSQPNE